VCRGSQALSPNRAIILVGLVVENPLVVEDGQYSLGKVLRLQSSLTMQGAHKVGGELQKSTGLMPIVRDPLRLNRIESSI